MVEVPSQGFYSMLSDVTLMTSKQPQAAQQIGAMSKCASMKRTNKTSDSKSSYTLIFLEYTEEASNSCRNFNPKDNYSCSNKGEIKMTRP